MSREWMWKMEIKFSSAAFSTSFQSLFFFCFSFSLDDFDDHPTSITFSCYDHSTIYNNISRIKLTPFSLTMLLTPFACCYWWTRREKEELWARKVQKNLKKLRRSCLHGSTVSWVAGTTHTTRKNNNNSEAKNLRLFSISLGDGEKNAKPSFKDVDMWNGRGVEGTAALTTTTTTTMLLQFPSGWQKISSFASLDFRSFLLLFEMEKSCWRRKNCVFFGHSPAFLISFLLLPCVQ